MKQVIEQILQDRHNAGILVSPTRVIHTCLASQDAVNVLTKYGTKDVNVLEENLEVIMEKLEGVPVAARRGARLPAPTLLPSVEAIIEHADDMAKTKYGANTETGFDTFLYVAIDYCNQNGDTDWIVALQDSGFNIDQFNNDMEGFQGQVIKELCTNFNELAKEGKIDPVVGRDDEILRAIEILSKRKKNNAVLLGEAGVGKTAIAEGLALSIVEGKVPEQLKNAIVFNLEVGNMVAGTAFRGQFEEKMMNMLKEFEELEKSGKMPILFIDEFHSVMGAGNSGGLDFANIIKPALSRGKLRCLAATTNAEWHKFVNQDKALKRRFTQIDVHEPTYLQTIEILKGARPHYEEKHGVSYSDSSIIRMVDLAGEFINISAQPDKSLDLMDLAGAIHKLRGEVVIDDAQVENSICRMMSLTLDVVRAKKHNQEVEPIAPRIKAKLFGQDHAVDQVVKVVERSLAGLQDENKPVGQFLFVGPTGVGKTELAKLLAEQIKAKFMRIDMSEYQEQHSVSKIIGSPPGYIGYDAQSSLQKFMQKNPGPKVVLLDEMEKAHPKVFELFLQVMDNARLTDSQGEEMSFKNTILLMTSNVGARESQERSISFSASHATAKAIDPKAVDTAFSPEFRGRLNGVVYFSPLGSEQMLKIVEKYVKQMNETKLSAKGVLLTLDQAAEKWLSEVDGAKHLGARPIQNAVQKYIGDELTQAILYGEIKAGKKNVTVTVENDKLKFTYV